MLDSNYDPDRDIKFGGIHGTILLICWCIVADGKFFLFITFFLVAVISARYFRSKFYYLEFHLLLF